MVKTSIRFFNNKEVRAAWDAATRKWRFCAVGVAAALGGSVEYGESFRRSPPLRVRTSARRENTVVR